MSESQRKIITYIVLATGFSFLQVLGLTTTLVDSVEGDCPPEFTCARPMRTLHTLVGDYDGRTISHEQFERYRIEFIALTFVVEIILVLMIVKILREQEAARKTLK